MIRQLFIAATALCALSGTAQTLPYQDPSLSAHERTVTLTLPPAAFEFFDPQTNTMRRKQGTFKILYGNSSRPEDLSTLTIQKE